eukprot:TRINITY_DN78276_c0_g1_i1.p1 TRINITY_DN78276_c0_g1~~TRINITY_DN78276_c0_g1_i1.p1  ORF type:complete len:201 (-),score=39.06 TRINITY_DN78276_c0_g1_i1:19-621(-)
MGSMLAKLFAKLTSYPMERTIVMVGLDSAGKSTILYQLKIGHVVQTVPTIGFNVETVNYKNINFTVWDIGGQAKIRFIWKRYYDNASAVIFVVDSADQARIGDHASISLNDLQRTDEEKSRSFTACEELHIMMQEPALHKVPVLILANKQDQPDAVNADDLANLLGMTQVTDRKWHVHPTSAISGDGVHEALDWLAENID